MKTLLKKMTVLFLAILISITPVSAFASTENVVYEDFSNWTTTRNGWSTLLTGGSVPATSYYSLETSGSNSYLKISPNAANAMRAMHKNFSTALTDYQMVISADVAFAGATKWSTSVEVGLGYLVNGSNTNFRLMEFKQGASANPTRASAYLFAGTSTSAQIACTENAVEWHKIKAVADVTNNTALWTFYIDGTPYTNSTYTCTMSDKQSVYFATRELGNGCFDNIDISITSADAVSERTEIVPYDTFSNWNWNATPWYRINAKITDDARYSHIDGENPYFNITSEGTAAVFNRIAQYSDKSFDEIYDGTYKMIIKTRLASGGANCWSAPCEFGFSVTSGSSFSDTFRSFQLCQGSTGAISARFHNNTSTNDLGSSVFAPYDSSKIVWHDVMAVADVVNGVAKWTYYVDGTAYTKDSYTTDLTTKNYNSIYFATRTLAAGKADGFYDDTAAYAVANSAPFEIVSATSDEDGNMTVEFSEEIFNSIKNYVYVNDTLVAGTRIAISDDQRSIYITAPAEGFSKSPVTLKIAKDAAGVRNVKLASDYTKDFVVKTTIIPDEKYLLADEDFSDWNWSDSNWKTGAPTSAAVQANDYFALENDGENKFLKINSTKTTDIRRISRAFSSVSGLDNIVNGKASHKILIKERVAAGDSLETISAGEIGLVNAGSTKQTLACLYKVYYNNAVASRLHNENGDTITSENFPAYDSEKLQWYDIIAVADVVNGVQNWTYYVDGKKYTADNYTFDVAATPVDSVYFGTRGNGSSYIDDIGAYVLTGNHAFEVSSVAADDNGVVTVQFSSEIYKDNIAENVTVNGEKISAEDITVLPGQTGVEIKTKCLPYNECSVVIGANTENVFGAKLGENVSETFTISGTETLKVYMGDDTVVSGKNCKYDIYGVNKTGEKVTLDVVFAEYQDSTLVNISSSVWELESAESLQEIPVNTYTKNNEANKVKLFIWNKNQIPVNANRDSFVEIEKLALKLPSMFTDGCVIQRNEVFSVWGNAIPEDTVTVEINGDVKTATADSNGNWSVEMDAISSENNPYVLNISSEKSGNLKINDVLAGEVWLCAGQSNMELPLSSTDNALAEAESLNNSNLRYFYQTRTGSDNAKEDVANGSWKKGSKETALPFSAVGHYFGKEINSYLSEKESADVPVGLIFAAYGGSSMEAWTSYEAIENSSVAGCLDIINYPDKNKNPGKLFNGMINPLIPYKIKGAIWYQGESNNARTDTYRELQKVMLDDWRARWGYDFPFFIVQLAPYNGMNFEKIREAQLQFVNSTADTEMAVIMDAGNQTNIHPTNKLIVGERLALIAKGTVYEDESVQYKFPQPESYEIAGNSAKIIFKDVYSGLKLNDESDNVNGFEVCGADGVYYAASAKITAANEITVTSGDVSEIKGIKFAYSGYPNPPA